jgi:hypothetical protein
LKKLQKNWEGLPTINPQKHRFFCAFLFAKQLIKPEEITHSRDKNIFSLKSNSIIESMPLYKQILLGNLNGILIPSHKHNVF